MSTPIIFFLSLPDLLLWPPFEFPLHVYQELGSYKAARQDGYETIAN
jgi:hypothetical protein